MSTLTWTLFSDRSPPLTPDSILLIADRFGRVEVLEQKLASGYWLRDSRYIVYRDRLGEIGHCWALVLTGAIPPEPADWTVVP